MLKYSNAEENGTSFFFRFPRDLRKIKTWINAVNRAHWLPNDVFLLMDGAVMTQLMSIIDRLYSHIKERLNQKRKCTELREVYYR